jgi:hypothetical protein
MINAKDRVKFKSRKVFVEADPPADRSRPLEWRRSINTIDINANRFVIKEHHSVTEHDYDFDSGEADSELEKVLIKPKIGLRRVVSSIVPLSDIRDSVYRTIEVDKNEKIYSFLKSDEYLELTLTDDEPLNKDARIFAAGTQNGYAWIDEDEEHLSVNVSVGKDVLSQLISEIKSGRVAQVEFRIALDSFSFEVDDALREWYHPRDLVIDGRMAHAALESFSVISREYAQAHLLMPSSSSQDETAGSDSQVPHYQPQINNVFDTTYLKSIKTALWFIFGALIVNWLTGGR